MTICIALVCENGSTAVVLADRMAAMGDGDWAKLRDGFSTKLAECSKTTVMLHSGTSDCSEWVLQQVRSHNRDGTPSSPEDVYNQVHRLQEELTASLREKSVKNELGDGVSFNELTRSMAGSTSQTYFTAWQRASGKDAGMFLIAGVSRVGNHHKAQLFLCPNSNALGKVFLPYAAIGSGRSFAAASLDIDRFDESFSLQAAILAGVRAKSAAELAYGVGRDCDVVVIDSAGVRWVPKEIVEKVLADVRENYESLGKAEIPNDGGRDFGKWWRGDEEENEHD